MGLETKGKITLEIIQRPANCKPGGLTKNFKNPWRLSKPEDFRGPLSFCGDKFREDYIKGNVRNFQNFK